MNPFNWRDDPRPSIFLADGDAATRSRRASEAVDRKHAATGVNPGTLRGISKAERANIKLKIAGGREKVLRDMQSWIFFAGGSSFLIGNYLTTFGRTPKQDHQMLKDLGVSFHLYNEMEVQADPDAVPGAGPGAEGVAGAEATYMQRKSGGRVVALEVAQPALSGGGCCGK